MAGLAWKPVCQFGFLSYLLLFPYMSVTNSVSVDLTELRNKVAKINVNQRGNLWATGHFMGKKSVLDSPALETVSEWDADHETPNLQDLEQLISQEVLKIALRTQPQDTIGKHHYGNQEQQLLMKLLKSFIQNRRK